MSAEVPPRERVAVAVVAFNERELLAACLPTLEDDSRAGRAEVWVVDNGSGDGTAELVRERFPWVHLIASERNLGYGPAVNLVAARTDCAWIAPANQDVELQEGALMRMVEATRDRPGVGAVAPRLVDPAGATQHSVHPFPTVWLTLLFNLGVHRLSRGLADRLCIEGGWNPDRPREVPWALGAFLLVRREAFDAAGAFDPAMWLHAEDLDLAWRLRRAGWRIWFEPAAVVRHEGSVSTRKAFGSDVEARFMEASYVWMARRRGVGVAWSVAAINVAGASLRALALAPPARVLPGRFAPRRESCRRWARIHRAGLASPRRLRAPTGSG